MSQPEWLRKLNVPLEALKAEAPIKSNSLGIPQVEFVNGVPMFVTPVVVAPVEPVQSVQPVAPSPVTAIPQMPAQAIGRGIRQPEDEPEERLLDDSEIPSMPADFKPLVNGMPLLPITPTKLPEKPLPDPANPGPTGEAVYAAAVEEIRRSNPTDAELIARLRLYESQYVGLITTVDQAVEHIIQCRTHGTNIGGREAIKHVSELHNLKHKAYIDKRYANHKLKKAAVEAARVAWKKAVADRAQVMKEWDAYVKHMHEQFTITSKMDPDLFKDPDQIREP